MKAATKKTETAVMLYDGNAPQRIPLEITEGSERFETAHNVGPVTDPIFLEFVDSVDPTIDIDEMNQALSESVNQLWRKVIKSVENIEVEAGTDYRDEIGKDEIETVINSLMGVHPIQPTEATSAIRKLSSKATVTVRTQALFSGKLLDQTHILKRKSDEHRKKYERIYSGISDDDGKAKQSVRAKAKAELYDELSVSTDGFKGKVPMRFKTVVIDYYFEPGSSAKK